MESLDKATKAAVAPRSKLDAGLTDLSKRVETLKLAVAKVPSATRNCLFRVCFFLDIHEFIPQGIHRDIGFS